MHSKKQWYWTPRNVVLLLSFLTEAAILNKESDAGELLNKFAHSITEKAEKGEDTGGYNDKDDESKGGVEAEDKKITKTGKTKQATSGRWSPSQTIATESWPSSRPSQSSHNDSFRHHSILARTSARTSGYVVGQTTTSPHCPIRLLNTTWVSQAF